MIAESVRRSWIEPVVVSIAVLLPGVVPGGPGPGDAAVWLGAGASQALSQFALLLVIIGSTGRLRDYGIGRLRPGDVLRAVPLLGIIVLLARAAAALAAVLFHGSEEAFSAVPSAGNSPDLLVILLSGLFAIAVGYREELFYRVYVIGALRERGAGTAAAVLVSTGLFAAGHAYQGLPGIVSSLLVGAVMAAAASGGFRLHALALAHAAYDFGVLMAAFGFASGST